MFQVKKKTPRDQLFNADMTSALDRNKTFSREAVQLMIPIAAALSHDPNDLPISFSTNQRACTSARHEMSKAIMDNFKPTCPLVLHWDSKILSEIVNTGSVDRLPVLLSGDGMDKLLGVPKMSSGTGENEANAVHKLLAEWQLTEKIKAMCFNTTSVNTGRLNGVCVGLENRLGHELQWLACHHHVLVKSFHHLLWTFKLLGFSTLQTVQILLECNHQAEFFWITHHT